MKGTKEVRRIALALAWADGFEVENVDTTMETWRWEEYLLSAQEIASWLTARGDTPPPAPLIEAIEAAS